MDREASSFHNRTRERLRLTEVLESARAELFILYGRRGVGKSALLAETLDACGLPYLYYRATRRTLPLQMAEVTVAVREAFPSLFLAQPLTSFQALLDLLAHLARQRHDSADPAPLVVVIDELPYLADVEPGMLTSLQHWWDTQKRLPNLKVFLCGSTVGFMEQQVLDRNAPLYNRRTGALKLQPLDYAEAGLFSPRQVPEERMVRYAVLGGMPSYLEQFDDALDLPSNLLATVLKPNTYLSEEPDWLLRQELRRDVLYGSMLRAVAQGDRRPSEIARTIGKRSAQDVAPFLVTLQELGLLRREVPVTEEGSVRSRNSLYFVDDPFLDFYYRFVDGSQGLVERGMGARVWQKTIAPQLHHYVSSPAFERACRQYLWRALEAEQIPEEASFTHLGRWWSGDQELDVVALDADRRVTLVGSCKWTSNPVDLGDYQVLLEGASRLPGASTDRRPHLALFSRSGFTARLQDLAADPATRLLLVSLDDMYDLPKVA
ncbi:MAG TPA: ATP-binding protein [Armatimonadota bacterium]|jgi:hypothetical protein